MNGNLGIDDLTIGVDSNGMDTYVEKLISTLFETTKEKIKDISSVETALNNGWQGVSKDRFMESLNASIEKACTEIGYLQQGLINEFDNLTRDYYSIDNSLISE